MISVFLVVQGVRSTRHDIINTTCRDAVHKSILDEVTPTLWRRQTMHALATENKGGHLESLDVVGIGC